MAFDSEGNFTRMHCWENDRLNEIGIISDRHDEEDDNFANALNNCFLRDGRVPLSGVLKMNGNQIKNMALGTASNDAVTKGQTESLIARLKEEIFDLMSANLDLGDIKASVQTANHGCWLLCDGQAVSRSDYADLFALIGTNFGAGDGVSTFNVPDYRGKFLRGLGGDSASDIYTTQNEGLPQVFSSSDTYWVGQQGNGDPDGSGDTGGQPGGYVRRSIQLNTTGQSELYGASEHVTPINQAVNWFIKAKKEA
ncbi:MAG: tail fiber protein [Alphaproteobacteria bacterium]|nr:tail fiber protein [Alphaproteobacteria bacterium]